MADAPEPPTARTAVQLLFAHGLESGPHGRKTAWLVEAGYVVVAPDCRGLELGARVDSLIDALSSLAPPVVLVGSSFGGIAGLVAAIVAAQRGHAPAGLLLCAPALQLPVPPTHAAAVPRGLPPPCPAVVVHGIHDEIIPIAHSRRWCRRHGVRLVECDDDHALGHSRAAILDAVGALAG